MARIDELKSDLRTVFGRHGLSFDDLASEATDVVLFGSRAVRSDVQESDWDVLVVGAGRSFHGKGLDVVVVPKTQVDDDTWLESELASHVATHGLWLKGEGAWRHKVRISARSADLKAKKLGPQLRTFLRIQPYLSPERRARHRRRLRRNLQRLNLLIDRKPMPTNSELDVRWADMTEAQRRELAARSTIFLGPETAELWDALFREEPAS